MANNTFYKLICDGDVVNSKVFSEICDGQMLESTRNYRAENDVNFAEFIADLKIIKNGGKPDFKTYGTTECSKSFCWTNKTLIVIKLII